MDGWPRGADGRRSRVRKARKCMDSRGCRGGERRGIHALSPIWRTRGGTTRTWGMPTCALSPIWHLRRGTTRTTPASGGRAIRAREGKRRSGRQNFPPRVHRPCRKMAATISKADVPCVRTGYFATSSIYAFACFFPQALHTTSRQWSKVFSVYACLCCLPHARHRPTLCLVAFHTATRRYLV